MPGEGAVCQGGLAVCHGVWLCARGGASCVMGRGSGCVPGEVLLCARGGLPGLVQEGGLAVCQGGVCLCAGGGC